MPDLFDRLVPADPSPRAAALLAPVPGLEAAAVHEARPGYADPPPPYYASPDASLRLYQADALELLRRMADESVDMIFADPPYFLSNGGITCVNGRMVKVDKGGWDKSTGIIGDHNFNLLWLDQCRRLLKPNGTVWVTGTSHNIHSVGYALQVLDYKILNDIAWYKVNPPPNLACRYFTHATETILWAAKSVKSRHTFNYADMKQQNGGKQMQSLWQIMPPGKSEKRHGKHPTQKPEALLKRIVEASTHPGELVLDPFCGSATTGVACARLGRRFIGVEREPEHIELAKLRLEEEYMMQKQRLNFSEIVVQPTSIGGGGRRCCEKKPCNPFASWSAKTCTSLPKAIPKSLWSATKAGPATSAKCIWGLCSTRPANPTAEAGNSSKFRLNAQVKVFSRPKKQWQSRCCPRSVFSTSRLRKATC